MGERGVAHERVLNWFADHGPVIPLTPFSLHQDASRVLERLESMSGRFAEVLEQLAGCHEWAVRLWRTARVAERLDQFSPQIRLMAARIAMAAPGRQYLLEKKRAALHADELRRISTEVAHGSFEALRSCSTSAKRLPIASATPPTAERVLTLHGVFLVREAEFADFQQQLSEWVGRYQPAGFEWEFTGPWPPYHFVEL